jgi:uncharacterized protein YcbK (DUF882 family)
MEKITPNFYREEFTCRCGCGLMAINPAIVQRLQVIRDIVDLPVLILSGYRCKKHNDEIRGAKGSQHMLGNAIDFRIEEYSMRHLAIMLTSWSGGFHFYQAEDFIHIDVGPERRW